MGTNRNKVLSKRKQRDDIILVSIKSNSAKKVYNNWKFHGVVVRKAFFFRLLRAIDIRHKHMCDENCQLKKGKNGRKLLRLKTRLAKIEEKKKLEKHLLPSELE